MRGNGAFLHSVNRRHLLCTCGGSSIFALEGATLERLADLDKTVWFYVFGTTSAHRNALFGDCRVLPRRSIDA